MSIITYLLAGLFLPLFPLSMPFNVLYARLRNPVVRCIILLLWPQVGLAVVVAGGVTPPAWVIVWSLVTSLLYALGLWTSFVGTSAWALLWVMLNNGGTLLQLRLYAFGISVPLLLLTLLCAGLEKRFGAAYLGLYGGLARSIPRFAGILVMVVLAITATPLFPTFFAMLSMILKTIPAAPLAAVGIAAVWLLWSWAGARLLQGLIVGPVRTTVVDLSGVSLWLYIITLGALVVVGVYGSELMI